MSEKIDRLCSLLDDLEDSTIPGKGGVPTSDKKQKMGLKLALFQMEQRMDFLENKLATLQENGFYDEAKLDITQEAASKPVDSSKQGDKSQQPKQEGGVRGALSRHEFAINEINLRTIELENSIKNFEPGAIQNLVRSIAELVMNEEKREVDAKMSLIKGSQQKNGQVVTSLQEELKLIDERLQKNIEKKIERKDLNDTKIQLRRQVKFNIENSCKN